MQTTRFHAFKCRSRAERNCLTGKRPNSNMRRLKWILFSAQVLAEMLEAPEFTGQAGKCLMGYVKSTGPLGQPRWESCGKNRELGGEHPIADAIFPGTDFIICWFHRIYFKNQAFGLRISGFYQYLNKRIEFCVTLVCRSSELPRIWCFITIISSK